MARHGDKRSRPDELVPGTLRVISVGLDYGRDDATKPGTTLADGERAYVARYALGRDYHKLMRQRLQKLADRIAEEVGPFGHRVFVDSAPVLERALARNAGLGWIGKHTCLIDKDGGSWFFLGEIYVDLPLPVDAAGERALRHLHALHRHLPDPGDRRAVPPRCAPLHLLPHHRARRRDRRGTAPADRQPHLRLRRLPAGVPLEQVRQAHRRAGFPRAQRPRSRPRWRELFAWSEDEFLQRTEGSAIRRSGYERWLRNIAVALGQCADDAGVIAALQSRRDSDDRGRARARGVGACAA